MSSHRRLLQEGSIPLYDPLLNEKQEVLESILHTEVSQVFLTIMKLNSITTKQKRFADDSEELSKLRKMLEDLEKEKLMKQKEILAKATKIKVLIKG
jgi:hypothetical protein